MEIVRRPSWHEVVGRLREVVGHTPAHHGGEFGGGESNGIFVSIVFRVCWMGRIASRT